MCESGIVNTAESLSFHDDFAQKKPGDIILQSQGELCFYFRLTHLAGLSTFSTLPPPSDVDLIDGTPLIPLHTVPPNSLELSLQILCSTLQPDTFDLICTQLSEQSTEEIGITLIGSAAFAKIYDLPILFALLLHLLSEGQQNGLYPFLVFAIRAISGVEKRIAEAAKITLSFDITIVPDGIITALQHHAPQAWPQLMDLHLRHHSALARYRALSVPILSCHDGCNSWRQSLHDLEDAAQESFGAAITMEEVIAVAKGTFGLDCDSCAYSVRTAYRVNIDWLKRFAFEYVCSSGDRTYGRSSL